MSLLTKTLTLADIRNLRPCYNDSHVAALWSDGPQTLEQILTRRDGPWAEVSDADRIWVLTRAGVLPGQVLRLFACRCAERALSLVPNPDPRSVAAVEVARRYAVGEATAEELAMARKDAYAADAYAAYAAARAATGGRPS